MKQKGRIAVCLLAAVISAGSAWAQLDPPPGPVAPTMKPLDEVEPRTPISELPFTILEPGSYYLTRNLTMTVEDVDGLTIAASNVTIDLNGFTLMGTGSGSGSGIVSSGALKRTVLRNGSIDNWGAHGVSVLNDVLCEKLSVTNNGVLGLNLGIRSAIVECAVRENGVGGILTFQHCRVEKVIVEGNTNAGLQVGASSVILDCIVAFNGWGIIFDGPSIVTGNVARQNSNAGIKQTSGSGSVVSGNMSYGNVTHGIDVLGAQVTDNDCRNNVGSGIHLRSSKNMVEQNFLADNGTGISTSSQSGGYIANNKATENTVDYDLDSSTVGTGDNANISF